MERTKRITTAAIVFLAVFHQVGLIGLNLEASRGLFQQLIPLNLVVSLGLLAWFHRPWSLQFGVFIFSIFWAGYLVELAGVTTGMIFGSYSYGQALGFKIAQVPPLIGLNWVMLLYITGIMARAATDNIWLQASVGAALMVLLDILIEPMAIRFDMWYWAGGVIPLQNYFAWYVISWFMHYAFHMQRLPAHNQLAVPLYLIQLIFFASFLVIG
ncbi:MAG: carotenoid biosynthesis protein [Bacteroidia bacterium]|nr:carotenoid biosynthesis protein [Bacteroidia bacterium]